MLCQTIHQENEEVHTLTGSGSIEIQNGPLIPLPLQPGNMSGRCSRKGWKTPTGDTEMRSSDWKTGCYQADGTDPNLLESDDPGRSNPIPDITTDAATDDTTSSNTESGTANTFSDTTSDPGYGQKNDPGTDPATDAAINNLENEGGINT